LRTVAQAKAEGTVTGPVEWITTTSQKVAPLSHVGPAMPDVPIYAVHISGNFVLAGAPRPYGGGSSSAPKGTQMVVFVPIGNGEQGGGGMILTNQPIDLTPYGKVHTFQP